MTDTLRTFLALAGLLSSSAWGTTYYVNDNTDAPLGGAVTCVTQQPCTLRAAIAREEYEEAARLRDLLRKKDPHA